MIIFKEILFGKTTCNHRVRKILDWKRKSKFASLEYCDSSRIVRIRSSSCLMRDILMIFFFMFYKNDELLSHKFKFKNRKIIEFFYIDMFSGHWFNQSGDPKIWLRFNKNCHKQCAKRILSKKKSGNVQKSKHFIWMNIFVSHSQVSVYEK